MSGDGAAEVFLQWKGTKACLDFFCTCGQEWHFDGYFARELTCGHCGQTWELPSTLNPVAVTPSAPLILVYGTAVINPERGAVFTVQWPRSALEDVPGTGIVTIQDECGNVGRAVYADVIGVKPSEDRQTVTLTLRTRDPV